MLFLERILDLQIQNLEILFLGLRVESLILVEEAGGCGQNLSLVNSPGVAEVVQDALFVVEHLDGAFLRDVLESNDAVRDSLGLEQPDPADLGCVVAVSPAAGFRVHAFDVDDSKLVPRDDTALVQVEAVLSLGLCLIHS